MLLVAQVVGRVTAALSRNDMLDDTLLVVTSDNGATLVNYDGGHREPFLLMLPRHVEPSTTCNELLSLADVFATFADIVGSPLPADAAEDSLSFAPLISGVEPDTPPHKAIVHHTLDGMFSVRMGPWKAIMGLASGGFSEPRRYETGDGPVGRLYNLDDDSRETNNLWDKRTDIVAEARQVLEKYQRSGRSRDA